MSDAVVAKVDYSYPDSEISWAGECPWTGRPCFGTGDGLLIFSEDVDEASNEELTLRIFEDEAVNGVAFADNHMAISSRSQVSLMPSPLGSKGLSSPGVTWNGGAHGVTATAAGGFVAPLGHDGLLLVTRNGGQPTIKVARTPGKPINYYQLNALERGPSGEVFAAAARTSGLMSLTLQGGSITPGIIHQAEGIDIVSVCSLQSAHSPRAVVALNRDGRLVWTMDIQENKPPQMIELDGMTGTMESVFSTRGHIFVLTDSELITIPHLAEHFLTGVAMNLFIDATILSIEAVDAFLVGDELLVIAGKGVICFPVNDLVAGTSRSSAMPIAGAPQDVPLRTSMVNLDWSIPEQTFGELIVA